MIDRQKLETVLTRRFPTASRIEIAAAANAIVALEREGRAVAADGFSAIERDSPQPVAVPRRHRSLG